VGPLQGVKVVEIASIGPGPWCAMMLSDMGAEVIRVDRADHVLQYTDGQRPVDFVNRRGRRSIGVDLKNPAGAEVVLRLVAQADALIEGSRPGVAERLGIGPDQCLQRNPRLVYGRMTGWGQQGPLSASPGHDLNYLAITGLLHAIGPAEGRPVPPLNLVGDYGGGGMLLAFGIVSGLLEASRSGRGQVLDAAMVDGVSLLGVELPRPAAGRRVARPPGVEPARRRRPVLRDLRDIRRRLGRRSGQRAQVLPGPGRGDRAVP
jgi:alpha-methylacyl-CoA racemase